MNDKLQDILHGEYLSKRRCWAAGLPKTSVQKSFEELIYGVMGRDSWRSTHISHAAIKEYVEAGGPSKNVQRAHGVLEDRIDRAARADVLLGGPELPFDAWWKFYTENDTTVLITKTEHNRGDKMFLEDMIALPPWEYGMFDNAGFSVRIRKKKEIPHLREIHDHLCGSQSTGCPTDPS